MPRNTDNRPRHPSSPNPVKVTVTFDYDYDYFVKYNSGVLLPHEHETAGKALAAFLRDQIADRIDVPCRVVVSGITPETEQVYAKYKQALDGEECARKQAEIRELENRLAKLRK
jgi:hypothetical protein